MQAYIFVNSRFILRRIITSLFFVFVFAIVGCTQNIEHSQHWPDKVLNVVVLGDTGIGERTFNDGFDAVNQAMLKESADVLLHVGDFAYNPINMPEKCDPRYVNKAEATLVNSTPGWPGHLEILTKCTS